MVHQLLIEPVYFTRSTIIPFLKSKNLIQKKRFYVSLKIKNLGNDPTNGFTIKNIIVASAHGQDMCHKVKNSYHVDSLNPGQTKLLMVEKMGTFMHGLVNISAKVLPDENTDKIKTFQRDSFTHSVDEFDEENEWLDYFFIKSKTEDLQDHNHTLLVFLSIAMVIIMGLNLYYFYEYQIKPQIIKQNRNNNAALQYCQNNLDGQWPKTDGSFLSCVDVVEMLY